MFDRRTGGFYTKATIRADVARRCRFSMYLASTQSLEKCVCFDEVLTKTPCGHTLCFPCRNKFSSEKYVCPACRGDISYVLNEED